MNELQKFRVVSDSLSVPESIYYVKNFIDEREEKSLIDNVLNSPKPKWTVLSNRRLQNWGGLPHTKGMFKQEFPRWLETYTRKLSAMDLFSGNEANHVLINEYLPGQGIMAHEDGPLFYPTVTTINTGSHTVLDFYKKITETEEEEEKEETDRKIENNRKPVFSILSEPRSLLVLQSDAYKTYLHGIEELTSDTVTDRIANISLCDNVTVGHCLERQTRYSFTIRYVPKVLKTDAIFGKFFKK